MNHDDINKLARKLEQSKDIRDIYDRHNGRSIADELGALARTDLYGAARLWEQYIPPGLKAQPGAMPTIVHVARISEHHFEGRARQERHDVAVPTERDCVVGRPMAQETYCGPIVGETPDYVVQRVESGDYILHSKAQLSYTESAGNNVAIRYPFNAMGGIGLVSANTPAYGRETAHQREHQKSNEREFG